MRKNKTIILLIFIIFIISSIFMLTACTERHDDLIFGTSFSAYVKGPHKGMDALIDDMTNYIDNLEPILSASKRFKDSDLNKINNANLGEVIQLHDVTIDNLRVAKEVYELTGGLFDPSIYPLVELWKFNADDYIQVTNYEPPTREKIDETLNIIGLDKCFDIDFENKTIVKKVEGAKIDLGGVAKGYAVDKAKDFASSKHEVLLNLGGDISVLNNSYEISIANPDPFESTQAVVASLIANSGECIATSGGYERYYKVHDDNTGEDIFYHHILNPKTGMPADFTYVTKDGKKAKMLSATIITEDGALGDAMSTSVMLLGYQEGKALIERLNLNAVLISKIEGQDLLEVEKIGNKF